jgi:spermidine/putrescine transport system ATP-binding protein
VGALGEVAAPATERARAGQEGVLAIRPEQVHIMAAAAAHELKNHFIGCVRDFLYIGDVTTYVVELENGTRIEALLANSAPGRAQFFHLDEPVKVAWRHDAGIFLVD